MVSIIIPIYNTYKYLKDCINSIRNQTYRDLQIIMIDDGSDVETAKLCDEIASTDRRIEVVHKINEGVSVARNVGLNMVKGDIVCFVDSDDTIHPEMMAVFARELQDPGIGMVMCDAVTILPNKTTQPDTISDFNKSILVELSTIPPTTLSRLAGSACRCGYRTDILRWLGAYFPIGLKFSEDRIFNLIAMSGARNLMYLKQPFYNRLIRKGSACFRFYPDMTEQLVELRRVLLDVVNKYWGREYIQVYDQQLAGQILLAVTNFSAPANHQSVSRCFGQLKNLCEEPQIRECLINAGMTDLRSRLILKNRFRTLYFIGLFTNVYHKICHKGQYR